MNKPEYTPQAKTTTPSLTTSFDAETLRAAGADWIAPDLAHVPADVLGG